MVCATVSGERHHHEYYCVIEWSKHTANIVNASKSTCTKEGIEPTPCRSQMSYSSRSSEVLVSRFYISILPRLREFSFGTSKIPPRPRARVYMPKQEIFYKRV